MYRRCAVRVWVLGVALAFGLSSAGASAAEISKYLPDNTQSLVSVNVRQILDSAVFKKYGQEPAKKGLESDQNVQNALTMLNFDPLKDLDSVVVGAPNVKPGQQPDFTVVVHGKFDLDKFHQAAENHAKQDPDNLKIEKHDGTRVYETRMPNQQRPMPLFAAFMDKTTLVVSTSKQAVLDDLARKAGTKQATFNKDLEALVAKLPKDQSLWLAGVIPEDARKQLGQMSAQNPQAKQIVENLTAVTSTLELTDGVSLKVQIHTTSTQAADQLRTMLNAVKGIIPIAIGQQETLAPFAPMLNDVVESIKVTKEGKAAQIAVKVSGEDIDKGVKAKSGQGK